jgi:hypothetical protein
MMLTLAPLIGAILYGVVFLGNANSIVKVN